MSRPPFSYRFGTFSFSVRRGDDTLDRLRSWLRHHVKNGYRTDTSTWNLRVHIEDQDMAALFCLAFFEEIVAVDRPVMLKR